LFFVLVKTELQAFLSLKFLKTDARKTSFKVSFKVPSKLGSQKPVGSAVELLSNYKGVEDVDVENLLVSLKGTSPLCTNVVVVPFVVDCNVGAGVVDTR